VPRFELLSREHDREHFDCGVEPMNAYLRQTARQHQERGISRTFILTEDGKTVFGFFTLAATEGFAGDLPSAITKRLPSRIPAVILARLAVDVRHQRRGYGAALLAEAFLRVASASNQLGIAGLFVDAKDEQAAAYYRKFGFVPFVSNSRRLFLPLASIRSFLAD
jgi:GNAT superfamily N-acetyltransferase